MGLPKLAREAVERVLEQQPDMVCVSTMRDLHLVFEREFDVVLTSIAQMHALTKPEGLHRKLRRTPVVGFDREKVELYDVCLLREARGDDVLDFIRQVAYQGGLTWMEH